MAKFDNILEAVGRTPVVRINKLGPPGVNLFVKVEAFNPMGSVKDRLALGVIEDAERSGKLKPGQTVVEATSGNTGIGLAMVCAARGYPLVVTMAENFSVERRKIMRFLGAKVVLTPATQRGTGMLAKAVELADTHGWFLCRQFENEANADIHSRTTAQEILHDFEGERLDYWVTGFGTGGTLKGIARVLKEKRPETKIMVCEPDNSQLLGSGIAQALQEDGSPDGSHPAFRPHLMQGWSPDFIPKLTKDVVDLKLVDDTVPINGERYLTTPLFDDIPVEMTDEEVGISRSTPSYRFDTPACSISAQAAPGPEELTPEAKAFVADAVTDRQQPVVMFALEWCEFCWSVRRLFADRKVPFRDITLDSVEYQEGNRGAQIRAALIERTSFATIPQVFVGGEFIGGCTELFDAWKEGRVQRLMQEHGVAFEQKAGLDPYSFLPAWLHPR